WSRSARPRRQRRGRVDVVREGRPPFPNTRAGLALEPRSAGAVLALEVSDAAFAADAVAGPSSPGTPRPRVGLVAGDEQGDRGIDRRHRRAGGGGAEAGVKRR